MNKINKKPLSTFAKEMRKTAFREKFTKEYKTFLLSELLIAIMEENHKSVRKLAKEVGLSPTVIQNIRSGKQKDIKLSNFVHIANTCGYHAVLEKGHERIAIG